MNEPRLRAGKAYMHEIDGVRGIALTLVVLFHVFGNGRVSGGVDVFLVISAFFLTRKLLGYFTEKALHADAQERASWFRAHYLRVARRLIPSATIVIAGVLVATWLWAPVTQYAQTLREAVASALYYENWELINSQLAYGAAGPESSPLQHFWSLSVQGQFFLVWPLLALITFVLMRRAGVSFRNVFAAVVGVLTVASFVWALFSVALDQQVAYFDSFSRFWELGAGALMAFLPATVLNLRWVRESAVWVGLAMIAASGFLFDGATVFPGVPTLWPVLATVLVLFGASRAAADGFASRVLSGSAVRFLSKISYELYLWHWPVLVFYLQARGFERVGWRGAVIVLVVSVLLAVVTERVVSLRGLRSFERGSWRKAVAVPVVPLVAVTAVAAGWGYTVQQEHEAALRAASQPSPDHVGALMLTHPEEYEPASDDITPVPATDVAFEDRSILYDEDCLQTFRDEPGAGEVLVCDFDDYGDEKTVVITGGSYVNQWYPPLQMIAEEQGWRLLVVSKRGCRLTTDTPRHMCEVWNENAVGVISSYDPDAVITLGTVTYSNVDKNESVDEAMVEQMQALDDNGVPVIGVRGTPKFPFDVPECLETADGDVAACSLDRDRIFTPDVFETADVVWPERFRSLDLTDAICNPEACEPIVGNVLVYRDSGHITETYGKTLAPVLEERLREADPSLFAEPALKS